MKINLNIGASQTYIPGFINVDISTNADLSLDLNTARLPFEDSSVDLVFSYHTLEHLSNYLFALSEIHRVLKHSGRFLVGVPYVTSTKYNLVNPYHLHNFNEYSFDFFDNTKIKGSASETNSICFTEIFHRFHYIGLFRFLPSPIQAWCRHHLLNVVQKIDYGLLAVKSPSEILACDKKELIQEFDNCFNARLPYKK